MVGFVSLKISTRVELEERESKFERERKAESFSREGILRFRRGGAKKKKKSREERRREENE